MILLILILLDNDIAENPGPFSDEISIFHVNARSVTRRFTFKVVDTYTSTPPPKQFLSFLKGLS
jgi:hypothetical protein